MGNYSTCLTTRSHLFRLLQMSMTTVVMASISGGPLMMTAVLMVMKVGKLRPSDWIWWGGHCGPDGWYRKSVHWSRCGLGPVSASALRVPPT